MASNLAMAYEDKGDIMTDELDIAKLRRQQYDPAALYSNAKHVSLTNEDGVQIGVLVEPRMFHMMMSILEVETGRNLAAIRPKDAEPTLTLAEVLAL